MLSAFIDLYQSSPEARMASSYPIFMNSSGLLLLFLLIWIGLAEFFLSKIKFLPVSFWVEELQ